jgi:hypothetical protein
VVYQKNKTRAGYAKRSGKVATLMFFDETIRDQGGKTEAKLEFGRSSFYQEDSLYIRFDDKFIVVDRATAKAICAEMERVARYLALSEHD